MRALLKTVCTAVLLLASTASSSSGAYPSNGEDTDRIELARDSHRRLHSTSHAEARAVSWFGGSRSRRSGKKRDASTIMSGGLSTEGENHSPVVVPSGATLTSLPVQGRTRIAAFWTRSPKNASAEQAFVMIHGRLRDGNDYWTTMDHILESAVADNYPGASADSIVTAPQFYSTIFNSGQYGSHEMAWGDVNAWQAGEVATHPTTTDQTSFDALDAFVTEFSDTSKYPMMKNITFVGHGGGGQLIARYAMVAKDPPCNVHVRYVSGDPSSNPYFTTDRPVNASDPNAIRDCPWYNTWRYGFDNFTGTAEGLFTPQEYFQRYVKRDYVSIVGLQDTEASGDQYCMAIIQGGDKRRDRNLCWYKYISLLSGTDEDLDDFPCTYDNVPNWSNMTGGALSVRLSVVADAQHDAEQVYASPEGRSALFSSGDVLVGWRPRGWKAGTGFITPGTVSCAVTTDGTSSSSAGAPRATGPTNASTRSSTTSPSSGAVALSAAFWSATIFAVSSILFLGMTLL